MDEFRSKYNILRPTLKFEVSFIRSKYIYRTIN